jgi:hypothetical protein
MGGNVHETNGRIKPRFRGATPHFRLARLANSLRNPAINQRVTS